MSRQPEVLWAQRSDKVYLTISLPDAKDVSAKSEPEGFFSFSATGAHGESFSFNLELYEPILPELWRKIFSMLVNVESIKQKGKVHIGLRNIICSIHKEKKGWWKRLLKSEEKPAPYIKVDWNKWCDEDEESEQSDWPASDEDDEGHEGEESEDEDGLLYLPDLEKARGK